ncbi:hypothetical protein DMUE_1353 [Dictyocoela muelleri]|nr:hypothetical protein DMUE_1353 [Dictyocoela muelleri]
MQTDHNPIVLIDWRNKYEAVLDTGADISLISAKVAKKEKLKRNKNKRKINQAVGHFNTMRCVFVKLSYENKTHTMPLHVVADLHAEIIIGTDTLKKLKIDPLKRKIPQILIAEEKEISSFSRISEKLDIGDVNTAPKIQDLKNICEKYRDIFSGDGDVRILDENHTIELFNNHNGFKCPKYRHNKIMKK